MNKLIAILEKKGILATLIGIMFAAPINAKLCYNFYRSISMTDGELKTAAVMNLIGMLWFMLPSVIEIKSKLFEVIIKD